MKVYRGYGGYSGTRVTVQEGDGPELPLEHHKRHSPTGFSWGYFGSGPSELARCILIDHFGQADIWDGEMGEHRLPVSYHEFKAEVVARWPWPESHKNRATGEPIWQVTSEQIDAWCEAQREEAA